MKLQALALATLTLVAAAVPARADDAALLRCRAIADAGVRLACYDALPAAAAASPRAAPPAAAAPSAQQEFGLPNKPGGEVKAIDSHIVGRFTGWGPNQLIELANGQVWRIADGSRAYFELNNPKVSVERGASTAFYLVIEGTNHTPRVQRVK